MAEPDLVTDPDEEPEEPELELEPDELDELLEDWVGVGVLALPELELLEELELEPLDELLVEPEELPVDPLVAAALGVAAEEPVLPVEPVEPVAPEELLELVLLESVVVALRPEALNPLLTWAVAPTE